MRSLRTIAMGFVAGSAMTMVVGGGTARAEEATTSRAAATARAEQGAADAARERAEQLALMGGPAYKSGAMDQANREFAAHQAAADEARAVATAGSAARYAPSPATTDAQDRLAALEAQGGWAYKSGAVDRQEAELNALAAEPTPQIPSTERPAQVPESAGKPVELVQPQSPAEPAP
ncbi:MAG TPA: hypothetical protein VHL80_11870 [Polyangia bacterium]|nr:hypothetical protein [Polyangia bacterium]